MATLSIVNDSTDGAGAATIVASPIFILKHTDGELVFEVFETDAGNLRKLIGSQNYFSIDGPFWARLDSLESCVSTHQGLALLRHKPTLLAKLTLLGDSQTRN